MSNAGVPGRNDLCQLLESFDQIRAAADLYDPDRDRTESRESRHGIRADEVNRLDASLTDLQRDRLKALKDMRPNVTQAAVPREPDQSNARPGAS